MLRMAGAQVWRVGFNAGDRVFWPHRDSYIAFQDSQDQWADTLDRLLSEKRITDIVLYGDTRPLMPRRFVKVKPAVYGCMCWKKATCVPIG